MEIQLVYITTRSDDEARRIGETLVNERLAACVNIISGMTSIFQWEGEIQSANETILIAKTEARRFEVLEKRVTELHSDDVPCIVALPAQAGHAPFMTWIHECVTDNV